MSTRSALADLREQLAEIHDLDRAKAVLEWDERTMMPPGGAASRADQIATLTRLRHERLAAPELGRLLDKLQPFGEDLPYESDEAALIRVVQREHDRATRVPAELEAALARAGSRGQEAWLQAREQCDYSIFRPHLEWNLELKIRYIERFDADDPYDPLLEDFEPGMTTAEMERLLGQLKEELVPFVRTASERAAGDDDSFLYGDFPVERQRKVVKELLDAFPMPADEWRLDETTHPFASALAPADVRLTTRYDREDLGLALFSCLHEYGHGLYENGVDRAFGRTPLGKPRSLGVHESQSRMWENLIGRGRAFWQRFYPLLANAFPERLGGVDSTRFHRAVNKVKPSLIRIEADELTYDLHVLLRFELERELITGRLAPADLPDAWNERVDAYLGIEVPDDTHGVLQDIHWAEGAFGYFPTYSLGNIVASQLWASASEALPQLDEQLERGELEPLHEWLRENVHRHGQKFLGRELVERATGRPIEVGPYLAYLRGKFGALYGIE